MSRNHRDAYEMDYCYEQNEDNGLVFSREIKPLISKVFDGQNVTIIAYGARGSGKTYTIQVSLHPSYLLLELLPHLPVFTLQTVANI